MLATRIRLARRHRGHYGHGSQKKRVHEAYLTLVEETGIPSQNRGHVFAVAARVMRRLVVDYARARGALRTVQREWPRARAWLRTALSSAN